MFVGVLWEVCLGYGWYIVFGIIFSNLCEERFYIIWSNNKEVVFKLMNYEKI